MSRFHNSWAILPATMCLWNKRKITVAECASVWKDGTVLVCKKDDRAGFSFIHGCSGDYGVKIGDFHRAHHDQTGADKGFYQIVNILHWKLVDGKVVIEAQVPFDESTKASLAVFK